MLRSLEETAPETAIEVDAIIVGAGLAGLFLAARLADRGLRVLVLESGGRSQIEETHPLNNVEMSGATYEGAAHGRFRCLGGTSTRWGGALLPYLDTDLMKHPCGWHSGWGTDEEALSRTLPDVEAAFGVTSGSYEGGAAISELLPTFKPRLPKWPAFRKRNTANIFGEKIRNDGQLQVWTDATVTKISLNSGRVSGVVAESLSENSLTVKAPCVTLACGAIEATRMLLLLDRAHEGRLFPKGSPLGLGFHDHLSAPIADLQVFDRREISRLFGFRFVPGGMRNLRFELSAETRFDKELPGAFLHVAFSRDEENGFEGLRRVLQSAQSRKMPSISDIGLILADMPWFARAVWWRAVEKRLYPPPGSTFELHLVTEQEPNERNTISLSETQCDPFGLPLARIDWHISDLDIETFLKIADHTAECWSRGRIGHIADLNVRSKDAVVAAVRDGGGIFHPAGTTRIGDTAKDGVVDNQLRVHGVPGLRALATSVFPSIGGSSPSLALTQMAVRMADEIARECSRAMN